MAISGDYAVPVVVNGFTCRNCTDVDNADKHIDPAHPKSGPYGVDAKDDPSVSQTPSVNASPAVTFGGVLATTNATSLSATTSASTASAGAGPVGSATNATGTRFNLYV